MSHLGPAGHPFEMETIFIFRNKQHVVIYRTEEELLEMMRRVVKAHTGGSMTIEVEVISTAVEQAAS